MWESNPDGPALILDSNPAMLKANGRHKNYAGKKKGMAVKTVDKDFSSKDKALNYCTP